MATKLKRNFIEPDLIIDTYADIKPYFDQLLERPLLTSKTVWQWLLDRSELDCVLNEEMAWRYIRMNCDTSDEHLAQRFQIYVSEVEPQIAIASNQLDIKFFAPKVMQMVDKSKLFIVLREIKKELELFREENVPLEAALQLKEQEYGFMASKNEH